MNDDSKGRTVLITAIVSAISAIVVAWITAGNIAKEETTKTINDADTLLAELIVKTDEIENKLNALSGKCPRAITKNNFNNIKIYSEQFESGGERAVELVNVSGAGCLVSGSILGYYFLNENAGTNYTITLVIDGNEQKYPPRNSINGTDILSYAQDSKGQNTGVLILPSISFKNSLKVKFYYPGGGKEISSYAMVIIDN